MTASMKRQSILQKKTVTTLTNRYDLQQKKLNALKKVIVSSGSDIKNLSKSQRLLAAKTVVANRKLTEQAKRIEKIKRVENHLETRRQRQFDKEKQRIFKLSKLEQGLQKARSRRNDSMMSVAAAGAFLVSGSKVIKQAVDLESAMVEVAKKASFKSTAGVDLSKSKQKAQMSQLQSWIVTAAPDLGMSPVELAQIVASGAGANIARPGKEQQDLQDFSKLAAKMSVAFDNLSAEEAGKSVATWMSSMKLDMSQSAELASAINHLSDNSAANTGAVTELMTRSGSIMMSAGLNHKQSAALGAAILSANGNMAEMGATAAKNVALTLTQGESMSGGQKKVLANLNMDPVQLSKDMQTDAVGTIYKLFEKIQAQPKHRQNEVVSTLFGKESIGAINPLIGNLKELKRVMAASSDEVALSTSLRNEFTKQQATTNFQTERVKNAFVAITSVAGKQLLPVIAAGAEVLADMALAGAKFIDENQEISSVVIQAVAAIAVLKSGMIAWRVASAALDIVSVKRKISEAKLGATTSKTAVNATRASIAIDKLNASMARSGLGAVIPGGSGKGIKGGKLGKYSKHLSKLPVVGTVAAVGLGAYALNDVVGSDSKTKGAQTGQLAGSIGGSMAGAAAGAALGSFVPIVGTAVGGILGMIVGESLFSYFGGEIGGMFDDKPSDKADQKLREVKALTASPSNTIKDNEYHLSANNNIDLKQSGFTGYQASKPALTLEYKPNVIIHGDARKADIDAALAESEKRVSDFVSQSLSDRLDSSMSDHIPNY
jgi:TP901 family phage tail tape measure protein